MDQITLKEILKLHREYLRGDIHGKCANLRNANLSYANLRNADLSYANLRNANLSYANLRNADLTYANLSYADLRNANLRNANLSYANLRNANLSYADLSYANLSYANLRNADLSYADLSYANLRNANLRNADLSYADLSYARYSLITVFQINFGKLSEELTLELMRHDCECLKNGKKLFEKWSKENICPFSESARSFYFREDKKLWKYGKPRLRGFQLWKRLAEELKIKI